MKRLLGVVTVSLLLLLATVPVSANQIVNGDFSKGLYGWSKEDLNNSTGTLVQNNPSSLVSNDSGYAELKTNGIDSGPYLISLYQQLFISDWAKTLSFDISIDRGEEDSNRNNFTFPDFLEVSYLDSDNTDFDKNFVGLDINGPYVPNTFPPTSLDNPSNTEWYSFEFDISDLVNRGGTLYFDLSDQDDGYYSIASVDNVRINPAPVPEPTTLVLSGLGLLLAGASILRIRRKQTRGGALPQQSRP